MKRLLTAAFAAVLLIGLLPFQVLAGVTPQTITFNPLPGATYGDPDFTVSATSDSGLTVEFASLTPGVCTVATATVSIVAAGTCTIEASQPGDATYDVAPVVDQGFLVAKATLTVTASSPADGVYGDPAPAVTPGYLGFVGTDGVGVIGAAPACGTAYIAGDAPATYGTSCAGGSAANYDFGFVAGSFHVGTASLTVTASSPSGAYNDPVPAITPGYSGFVLGEGAGNLTTAPACSTSYLQGDVPGGYPTSCTGGASANYGFTYVPGTFTVGTGAQTISFGALGDRTYGDPDFTVSATASSGLVVAFTSQTTSECTVAGATVTIKRAGTCTIRARQPGDSNWSAATSVDRSFTIAKADQTIGFTSTAPTDAIPGGPAYTVTATATSGLVVTFTIDAASSAICTLDGTPATVSFTAVGACTIDAHQAGGVDWNAAPPARQVVGVGDRAPACPDAAAGVVMNVAKTGAAGCTDLDLDPLTYAVVAQGSHGTASIDGTGTWTYTPALNYVGPDTFTFKANDTVLDSNVATITLTVTNLQDDARNDAFSVGPVARSSVDVLANDLAGAGETGQPLTITAVTQGTKGRVATNGSTVTYDPIGCSTGSDLFSYTISDGRTTDTATVIVLISTPGQNGVSPLPVTDTPAISFVTGSTMSAAVSMRLSWCGVAAGSAKRYDLRQGSNGVSFPTTLLGGTAATSSVRSLAVLTGYAWAVRTIDASRRVGAWALSPVARLLRIQDAATVTIRYSSGWHVTRSSGYSGGTEHYTTARRASATVRLTNVRQFALVSSRGPGRGSVQVWVDGVLVATVSERAGSTQVRRVLYARALTSGGGVSHTIRIVASGNGRVDLDSLLALS